MEFSFLKDKEVLELLYISRAKALTREEIEQSLVSMELQPLFLRRIERSSHWVGWTC